MRFHGIGDHTLFSYIVGKNLPKYFVLSALLLVNLSAHQVNAQDESADQAALEREQRLFKVYERYHSQETPDDVWQAMVEKIDAGTQSYVVQKGDNLWAISQTLFGDPNFWPKLWSLNPGDVGNPHQITVNMNVVFRPGTTDVAPELSVTDQQTVAVEGGEAPAEVVAPPETAEDIASKIPPRTKPELPVLETFPDSLPEWTPALPLNQQVQLDIGNTADKNFQEPAQLMGYYISEAAVNAIGEVIEVESGNTSAGLYQYIVVEFEDAPSSKMYSVVKKLGNIKDPNSSHSANLIESQGEIEILEKVRNSGNYYRALVKNVANLVQVGSNLIGGGLPRYRVEKTSTANLSAEIVGGEFEKERQLFGLSSIVFLNIGSQTGAALGQTLPVYNNIQSRREDTTERINPRRIGEVTIVDVSANFATAVVTNLKDEIRIGDKTTSKE